jgi:hypothetical protein
MPQRSDRSLFGNIFGSNPFKGKDPRDIYTELRWGNESKRIFNIDAPEPLVSLGELAYLEYTNGNYEEYSEEDAPFLALGAETNYLYIIPKKSNGRPNPVSEDTEEYEAIGTIKQTDYYSEKGDEEGYYYHEHEKPYPVLYEHYSGIAIIVPSKHKGKRSYAVVKEGIVG